MLQLNLQEWSPSRWRGDVSWLIHPISGRAPILLPAYSKPWNDMGKGDIGKRGALVGEFPEIKILNVLFFLKNMSVVVSNQKSM